MPQLASVDPARQHRSHRAPCVCLFALALGLIGFRRPQLASAIRMVEASAGLTGREKAELIATVRDEYAAPLWSPQGARTFAYGATHYNPLKRPQARSALPGAA